MRIDFEAFWREVGVAVWFAWWERITGVEVESDMLWLMRHIAVGPSR